jgi:dihydropteroate synthase-like protein
MAERILFLTGKLAEKSLRRVLDTVPSGLFTYDVRVLGVAVAALMTTELIKRRLNDLGEADRVIVPGRCRGDLDALQASFGVPFERGPEELKDLHRFFGVEGPPRDLSNTDVKIFAEIVDAPELSVEQVLERAAQYRRDGADVIDVGCLPDTPFSHLEKTVDALKRDGFAVSVDSQEDDELLRGGGAGADYLFSLHEDNLWIAEEVASAPILVGRIPGDQDSLFRAIERYRMTDHPFYADAILDPIHHGFTESLLRYYEVRERFSDIEIIMGIGNLTELTHADSMGVNTLLMGIVSELGVTAVLTTEVSAHCRRAIKEIDRARRIMYAAREDGAPPRHIDESLLALHERKPFPYSEDEVRELAAAVKDDNYRIQVTGSGIHVYNRKGFHSGVDPYDLFPRLDVEDDGPHAYYLGLELARAQVALQLGKRYNQDEQLDWGCAVDKDPDDKRGFAPIKSTLAARRAARRKRKPG